MILELVKAALSGSRIQRVRGVMPANVYGRTLYVCSATGSDSNRTGLDINRPLKTLAAGVLQAQAGDTIALSSVHAETIATADAVNFSKANLEVVGMGRGSSKPTFTFSTLTTARMKISAAGVRLRNLTFTCGVDSLVEFLNIDAADALLEDVWITQTASAQVLNAIKATANATNLTIDRLFALQTDAGAASVLDLAGSSSGLRLRDSVIIGDYSTGCVRNSSGAAARIAIQRNLMQNLNAADPCIELNAAATGFIADNRFRNTQADAADLVITAGTAVQLYENYVVNADRETGKLVGTVSG